MILTSSLLTATIQPGIGEDEDEEQEDEGVFQRKTYPKKEGSNYKIRARNKDVEKKKKKSQ